MYRKAIILLFWWPLSLQAQIVSPWEVETEQFLYRIKNIEFFINRFNNQNDSIPITIDKTDSVSYSKFINDRTGSLVSLFDQVRIRNKSEKNFKERAGKFVRSVNDAAKPQYLHFTDSSWYAEARLTATYAGKPANLICILRINHIPTGGYEWAVMTMRSETLNLQDHFKEPLIILPPSAHGTDFISLSKLLQNSDFIKKIPTVNQYAILPLLADKKLAVGPVIFVRYHFLQLDGWGVTSEYVNRASKNAGWLIKDLFQIADTTKVVYVDKLMGR